MVEALKKSSSLKWDLRINKQKKGLSYYRVQEYLELGERDSGAQTAQKQLVVLVVAFGYSETSSS